MAENPGEALLSVSPLDGLAPPPGRRWHQQEALLPKKWSRVLRSQHSPENAARERSRVRNLRQAFHSLQAALPSVPPDTKLSKLDVLLLATNYIAQLTEMLQQDVPLPENAISTPSKGYLHPVKKWPMRSLLYCGRVGGLLSAAPVHPTLSSVQDTKRPPSAPLSSDP